MKQKFGQNLSQIGALYDFYGQKNLGHQSSEIELRQPVWLAWRIFRVLYSFLAVIRNAVNDVQN